SSSASTVDGRISSRHSTRDREQRQPHPKQGTTCVTQRCLQLVLHGPKSPYSPPPTAHTIGASIAAARWAANVSTVRTKAADPTASTNSAILPDTAATFNPPTRSSSLRARLSARSIWSALTQISK